MPDAGQTFVRDEVSAGLRARPALDEPEPCLLVEGIDWDSGLRGSGLRVGDRILAVNQVSVAQLAKDAAEQKNPSLLIGQYAEPQYWAALKAQEGAPVVLRVRRRSPPQGWATLDVQGVLRAKRHHVDAQNSPTLWPGGPNNYERDGFNDSWPQWHENLQKSITEGLLNRWQRPSYVSRFELKQHLEQAPRVALLSQKYPGPFAQAIQADFDELVRATEGTVYTLTDDDLAYRRADDERIADLAVQGLAAFKAACASVSLIPPFPAPHPIHTAHDERVGQAVLLENIPTQQWINDGDASYLLAGSGTDGWYALSVDAPPAQRLFTALRRYQRRVDPNIKERYTVLARIVPEARIVVFSGVGCWCWQVEPLAAWIGDALFVDVTQVRDGVSLFAGEEGLLKPQVDMPPDDAEPAQVLAAMIAAIKAADLGVWRQLFATWQLRRAADGHPEIRYHVWEVRDSDFEASRRSFATRLFDARVHWQGDVQVITTGDEFAGAHRLEEVELEVEHVGQFDGQYRAFNDVTVCRVWRLQRLDGGPWRISSIQHI